MIEHPAPPGSDEWNEAHLGIVTSRHIGRIVTNTWKASGAATQDKLLRELLAEWATGMEWARFGGTEAMEHGDLLQPEALDYYSALRERSDIREPGLIYMNEERLAGTTPDWLVGDDGAVEAKCPQPPMHISNVLACEGGEVPPDYMRQLQWHLYVTGREWCDLLSYHDTLAVQALARTEPLQKAFDAFDAHVPPFLERIREGRAELLEMGLVRT